MDAISSLYIHFPFCKSRCNYCDFFSQINCEDQIPAYEATLERQLKLMKEFNDDHHASLAPLETLYVGGGTPCLWGELGRKFLSRFVRSKNCEFTLEVNPGDVTFEEIDKFMEMGVNRFSIGTQSLDPFFLKTLGRRHSPSDTLSLVKYLSENHVNFSVDFMMGLPFSSKRNLKDEVEELLQFDVPHISAYILTVRSNYCLYDELPDEDYIANEFLEFSNLLKQHGFDHYEVSNFAKSNFKSKHNLKYWENKSVAAIGTSAVGTVINQMETFRYKFLPNGKVSTETITGEERELEELFLGLRSIVGIDPIKYPASLKWISRGLASQIGDRVVLNPKGFLIADSLIDELF